MNIITISREFGSGGREIGKRLADLLGYDYYDRQIIQEIAQNKGLSEEFVEKSLDASPWQTLNLNYRSSFYGVSLMPTMSTELLLEERNVLEEIAKKGRDCVIVGRNADIVPEDYHPFSIFVCAERDAKLKRCRERASEEEELSDKEMISYFKRIDRNRAATRELISDSKWGDPTSYTLTVNTTGWDLKELTPALAAFAKAWFEKTE